MVDFPVLSGDFEPYGARYAEVFARLPPEHRRDEPDDLPGLGIERLAHPLAALGVRHLPQHPDDASDLLGVEVDAVLALDRRRGGIQRCFGLPAGETTSQHAFPAPLSPSRGWEDGSKSLSSSPSSLGLSLSRESGVMPRSRICWSSRVSIALTAVMAACFTMPRSPGVVMPSTLIWRSAMSRRAQLTAARRRTPHRAAKRRRQAPYCRCRASRTSEPGREPACSQRTAVPSSPGSSRSTSVQAAASEVASSPPAAGVCSGSPRVPRPP